MGTAHAERKGRGGARSKEKGFPYPFSENEVRHCGMRFGCGGGGGSVPRSPSTPTLPAGAWRSRKGLLQKGGGERTESASAEEKFDKSFKDPSIKLHS